MKGKAKKDYEPTTAEVSLPQEDVPVEYVVPKTGDVYRHFAETFRFRVVTSVTDDKVWFSSCTIDQLRAARRWEDIHETSIAVDRGEFVAQIKNGFWLLTKNVAGQWAS